MPKRAKRFRDEQVFNQAVMEAKHLLDVNREISGSSTAEVLKTGLATVEFEGPAPRYRAWLFGYILGAQTQSIFWDALNLTAQDKLRNFGTLPPLLALWIANVLDYENWARPKDYEAQQSFTERCQIAFAVRLVMDKFDVDPTRRREIGGELCGYRGGSACDAVGIAANKHGYKTMERIWGDEKHLWPDLAYTDIAD